MHVRATAAAVLTALIATGCANAGPAADGPAPAHVRSSPSTQPVQSRWESCDKAAPASAESPFENANDALTLPLLQAGFEPVAVVACRTTIRQRPGGGTEMLAEEVRADDPATLLSALRLPDEAGAMQPCTADGVAVPWFALLDGTGRWIRPGVPVDPCRKPRPEFRAAYDRLATTVVNSRVVRQLESDEAARSGCSQGWADMAWTMGGAENAKTTTMASLPERTAVRRCVYDVPAAERGSSKPAGDFRSGGPLPAADWKAIRAEIGRSGSDVATCTTPASGFAVLHLEPGEIYVELDGCRRILLEYGNGPSVYRQGTARLTALLRG